MDSCMKFSSLDISLTHTCLKSLKAATFIFQAPMGSFDTKMLGNFDHKIKIELNNILGE
jgi:hypothetical protein